MKDLLSELGRLIAEISAYCGRIGKEPSKICLGCCGDLKELGPSGETAVDIIVRCMGKEATKKALMIAVNEMDVRFLSTNRMDIKDFPCIGLDKMLNAQFILQKCQI
jgi:hypothetical protein